MLGISQYKLFKRLVSFLTTAVLVVGLVSCGDRIASSTSDNKMRQSEIAGDISEVAPPEVIQQLGAELEAYQPQVTIVSPKTDAILQDTTAEVKLKVQDLPIFKNSELEMGPHLHLIVDNQPYEAVYNVDQPFVLKDLSPGTHTLRVFASRPWHESFKNEGAYAQTTFHVFTKTTDNNPNPAQPLLTYSRPKGSYGAEPIMLDFYLNNAPLHQVAQENSQDEIADWRIRVTVNGQSFVLDKWQPVYLKGFKSGKNWVRLEFIDELGNPVKNVFNDTVRVITYEPKGKDTLSKLVRGELSAVQARGIVDPKYSFKPPVVSPTPTVTPTQSPTPTPPVSTTPLPESTASPTVEPTPIKPSEAQQTITTDQTEPLPEEKPKSGGFFSRFQRPATKTSPSPTLPEIIPTTAPELVEPPAANVTPTPSSSAEETPSVEATPKVEPFVEDLPASQVTPTAAKKPEKSKYENILGRFRRPAVSPNQPSTLPEIVESPISTPEVNSTSELPQATGRSPAADLESETTGEEQVNDNLEPTTLKPTSRQKFRIIQAPKPENPDSLSQPSETATSPVVTPDPSETVEVLDNSTNHALQELANP
ncbi:MAG: hypothetical protein WBB28_22825 [Crinalium sp.]